MVHKCQHTNLLEVYIEYCEYQYSYLTITFQAISYNCFGIRKYIESIVLHDDNNT